MRFSFDGFFVIFFDEGQGDIGDTSGKKYIGQRKINNFHPYINCYQFNQKKTTCGDKILSGFRHLYFFFVDI